MAAGKELQAESSPLECEGYFLACSTLPNPSVDLIYASVSRQLYQLPACLHKLCFPCSQASSRRGLACQTAPACRVCAGWCHGCRSHQICPQGSLPPCSLQSQRTPAAADTAMLTGGRQLLLSGRWIHTVDSSKHLPGRLLLASLVSKALHHGAVATLL